MLYLARCTNFTIVIYCLVGLSVAQAKPLCPAIAMQEKSEGQWSIPEDAFTAQAAMRELQKLNQLMGEDSLTADSITWETSFVIIEGWYLKRQALEARKRGDGGLFIADFCNFMKNRAYVHH